MMSWIVGAFGEGRAGGRHGGGGGGVVGGDGGADSIHKGFRYMII